MDLSRLVILLLAATATAHQDDNPRHRPGRTAGIQHRWELSTEFFLVPERSNPAVPSPGTSLVMTNQKSCRDVLVKTGPESPKTSEYCAKKCGRYPC
ncbi:hypothetical protein L9F63_027449 [Diploptera punctata]|uniref:Uncharacterized protein n=1 Tax=Diploptera punctata TaxID=6984 RepID=A0AAD8ELE3_DIPPU|nr:hypothetical protein L9F63_027449 [Diploptera punctata]